MSASLNQEEKKIPIIVLGKNGRMGSAIIQLTLNDKRFTILDSIGRGDPLKPLGPGVLIDFSHHSCLSSHVEYASKNELSLLIGATGHDQAQKELIREKSQYIPILYAPNTSLFANVLFHVSALVKNIPGIKAHITDIHHCHKKDAPSGTALAIKDALSQEIPITSIRAHEVIGEHRIDLFRKNEQLELIHRVLDRQVFAEGALIAAQFLFGKVPGLYTMLDVLNLNNDYKK